MRKLYDCFLYHDERELLEIRLTLLREHVARFVVVVSNQTFTGLEKQQGFPYDVVESLGITSQVEVVTLDTLRGNDPWAREAYSRNALLNGIVDAAANDLIMVSDVDEIPRPSVLRGIAARAGDQFPVVLAQDYFNFKFNYQLVHGRHAVWAGPVIAPRSAVSKPEALRDQRWALLDDPARCVEDAGWHFSYLTTTDSVDAKLGSFSHQEEATQSRRGSHVRELIAKREGFHDHVQPASVWAVTTLTSFDYAPLTDAVKRYPGLILTEDADPDDAVRRAIRHRGRLLYFERHKMLAWFAWRDLLRELAVRAVRRMRRRDR